MLCLSYLLVTASGMGQGMVVEVMPVQALVPFAVLGQRERAAWVGGLHDGEQEGVTVGS